jgi:hypothetical protein
VLEAPYIQFGSSMISRAAARRRACRRGRLDGLLSVCLNTSSDILLSVKTRTVDDAQIGLQVCRAKFIASVS